MNSQRLRGILHWNILRCAACAALPVFTHVLNAQTCGTEEQAIERVIHASIGWAKEKDLPLLYSVIVNDSTYLEVDPGPRVIRGFDQFRKNERFWMHPEFKALRYEIRDLTITLSRQRDVAWFYCVLDDLNEWKGAPANWLNTRWTGVLERHQGEWKIMQMHFSFAHEE